MYRSLGLPSYPKSADQVDNGFKYIKPPMIKVLMGDPEKNTGLTYSLYNGLLSYSYADLTDKRQSENSKQYPRLKTFVVTSVGIKKDITETPLYLDSDFMIRDTFGFDVSLSLVEVTQSYMDQPVDFKSYYNKYITVGNDFIGKK
jgi:hypothetical protein